MTLYYPAFSLADYLKRMNKVLHADDPAYGRIPESRELVALYLLLYEMSGDPENLWRFVDYEYRKGNLTVQLKSDDSKTIKSAIAIIEMYAEDLETQGCKKRKERTGGTLVVPEQITIRSPLLARPAAWFTRLVPGESCGPGVPLFSQVRPPSWLAQQSMSPTIRP